MQTKRITQKQMQKYIDEIKRQNTVLSNYELDMQCLTRLEREKVELETKLKNIKPIVETVTVAPNDYESTKQRLKDYQKDYNSLQNDYNKILKELTDVKEQLRLQKETESSEQFMKKLKDETIYFCAAVATFLQEKGGYVWITDYINELPEYERKSYIRAANEILYWAQALVGNIENSKNGGNK